MRTCTCPDCGEDLMITCPSGHERASAGVHEMLVTPATLAAREPAPSREDRRARRADVGRLRPGSVASLVSEAMADGAVWTWVTLLETIRPACPTAQRTNIEAALSQLVRWGHVDRIGRGRYTRVAT